MNRVVAISVTTIALLAHSALVTSATGAGPRDRIAEIVAAASAVINDGAVGEAEREQRVRAIIHDAFHFEDMGRQALGPYWANLTPAQRREFVPLFTDVFEKSYNRLVLRFLGERTTTYLGASTDQHQGVVETMLEGGPGERLPVTYRLARRPGGWAVVDVIVDGVSLAGNYRAQFERIIRRSSYDTLLQRMQRLAQR